MVNGAFCVSDVFGLDSFADSDVRGIVNTSRRWGFLCRPMGSRRHKSPGLNPGMEEQSKMTSSTDVLASWYHTVTTTGSIWRSGFGTSVSGTLM